MFEVFNLVGKYFFLFRDEANEPPQHNFEEALRRAVQAVHLRKKIYEWGSEPIIEASSRAGIIAYLAGNPLLFMLISLTRHKGRCDECIQQLTDARDELIAHSGGPTLKVAYLEHILAAALIELSMSL